MNEGLGFHSVSADQQSISVASDSSLQSHKFDKVLMKQQLLRLKTLDESEHRQGLSKLLEFTNSKSLISRDLSQGTSLLSENNVTQIPNMLKKHRPPHFKLPCINTPPSMILSDSPPEKKILSDSRTLPDLHLTPRLQPLFTISNSISKAGYKSRTGTVNGKPKVHNQDAIIIKPNLHNVKGQYLFGISDGHGAQGHMVSQFLKEQIVQTVELLLPIEPKPEQMQKCLISTADRVNKAISESNIDIVFSGSTLISIIISGNHCACANLGDCKAVIGRELEKWQALALSIDHTLQNKKERERIISSNGRIERVPDSYGGGVHVEKFFMGNQDVPGLDITRSIGDKIGKFVGMLAVPEVKFFSFLPEDKFIIIGSSGLWKHITTIEAVCIVRLSWEANQIEQACEDLISEAERRWRTNCGDKEDISVIVIFLNPKR